MRALLAALLMLVAGAAQAEIPAGRSRMEVPEASGATPEPMPVWLYRAAGWRPGGPVVAVMHGVGRNAEEYRDNWPALAEAWNLLVVVPEFSARKYPGVAWYNYGGAVDAAGHPRPREEWSFFALDHAVAAVQRAAGAPQGPFTLFAHSAGAQFAHRYLLLTGAPMVGDLILANSGSYTLPRPDLGFPVGLQGVTVTDADLRTAFARPVILMLGEADTDPNYPSLPRDAWAMAEGSHRFARGWFFFDQVRRRAEALRTPFGWRVITVPGVGHDNAGMAEAAVRVLFRK